MGGFRQLGDSCNNLLKRVKETELEEEGESHGGQ